MAMIRKRCPANALSFIVLQMNNFITRLWASTSACLILIESIQLNWTKQLLSASTSLMSTSLRIVLFSTKANLEERLISLAGHLTPLIIIPFMEIPLPTLSIKDSKSIIQLELREMSNSLKPPPYQTIPLLRLKTFFVRRPKCITIPILTTILLLILHQFRMTFRLT